MMALSSRVPSPSQCDWGWGRGLHTPHAQVVHGLQRRAGDYSAHAAPLNDQANFVRVAPLARPAALPEPGLHYIHSWMVHLQHRSTDDYLKAWLRYRHERLHGRGGATSVIKRVEQERL